MVSHVHVLSCQYLEFVSGGHLSTKIYDKRDDFNFKIINFPNLESNIPKSPAYAIMEYTFPTYTICQG